MNTEKPASKGTVASEGAAGEGRSRWLILTVSRDGVRLAKRIAACLDDRQATVYTLAKYADDHTKVIPGRLTDFWGEAMARCDVLVCVMATGIVVRGVAPHLVHKSVDPAVLVLDSAGQYVISLLSGHLGGANDAAALLARRLGATPVITTGTDVKGTLAVDVLAEKLDCTIADFTGAKDVTAAILDDQPVAIVNEAGLDFSGIVLPANLRLGAESAMETEAETAILISDRADPQPPAATWVQIVPKTVTAGIGCKKDTPGAAIEAALKDLLMENGCHPLSVAALATIGLKEKEPGIRQACQTYGAELTVVPDEFVKMVQSHFGGSDFVEKTTGLRAVSEPCGYVASGFGRCIAPVRKGGGITLSLWKRGKEDS